MSTVYGRNPMVLAAAAAAVSMGVMGQSAEVVPRPGDLGGWMARNNRRRVSKGPKPPTQRRARLQRATGPGSINERNEMFALIEAGKEEEAVKYYRSCLNINYRAGKPKLHPDMVTWYAYYN